MSTGAKIAIALIFGVLMMFAAKVGIDMLAAQESGSKVRPLSF